MNRLKPHTLLNLSLTIVIFTITSVSFLFAQDSTKSFATKGVLELGGNITLQGVGTVSNTSGGNSASLFTFAPYVGYFTANGFELGINPFNLQLASSSGYTETQLRVLFLPCYNFNAGGTAFPFIEGLFGFVSGENSDGYCYGARGGVKLEFAGNALVNIGVQYDQIRKSSGGSTNSGLYELMFAVGFSAWK
jgi:hypothetical protein